LWATTDVLYDISTHDGKNITETQKTREIRREVKYFFHNLVIHRRV